MATYIERFEGPYAFADAVTLESTLAVTGAVTLSGAVTADHVAPTLTAAGESTDTIAVTFASGVAAPQQFRCEVFDSATMVALAATFTVAETGAGAEVAGSGTPNLIFTTDANGDATLTVTDVAGASSKTCYVIVTPLLSSAASEQIVAPAEVAITFDGA